MTRSGGVDRRSQKVSKEVVSYGNASDRMCRCAACKFRQGRISCRRVRGVILAWGRCILFVEGSP